MEFVCGKFGSKENEEFVYLLLLDRGLTQAVKTCKNSLSLVHIHLNT